MYQITGACPKCHRDLTIEAEGKSTILRPIIVKCDHCGATRRIDAYRREYERQKARRNQQIHKAREEQKRILRREDRAEEQKRKREFEESRRLWREADRVATAIADEEARFKDEAIKLRPCPDCEHDCSKQAMTCPECGHPFKDMRHANWNPGVAAILSFFIPGLGQIYKGCVGTGFGWLICTAIGYFAFIIPGIALHIICVFDAAIAKP